VTLVDALDLVNRGGVLALLLGALITNVLGKWRSERSHREVVDDLRGQLLKMEARADHNEDLAWRLVQTTERAADVATTAVTRVKGPG
jgi:hypothetical protein